MTQEQKKKYLMKQIVIPISILVIGLGTIFFVTKKLSKKIETPKEELKKEIFVLQQELASSELEFFGSLEANKESNLSAKVSGRISTISVDEGDAVKNGQLLAYLNPDQYGIDYRKKSDNSDNFENYREDQESYWDKEVKSAKEDLEIKEEELEYYKIYDPGRVDIAKENVNKAKAELRSAKRQRDAQDESLKQQSDGIGYDKDLAAQSVTDTKINAPFGGIVTKKYLEAGEVVAAGQPVITVADVSSFKVVVEVPDSLVDKLSVGLGARVLLDGISGEYSAKVTRINPQVDPVAKKIEVEVTLDSAPKNTKVDMFARVFIKFPERTAFFVPSNFVFSGFAGPFVLAEDGTQKIIKRGVEKDGMTEIAFEGITSGIKIRR